jgi:beta-glucanase (GH16 family)
MLDFSEDMLRIGVEQARGPDGVVVSKGGAIQSKQVFGFGTYTVVMRQSSTAVTSLGKGLKQSGSVSSCFLYLSNSESEIDIEYPSDKDVVFATNWHNTTPQLPPTSAVRRSEAIPRNGLSQGFHTYTLVWTPTSVAWYIDGKQYAQHTDHVPQAPAHIMLQHRGTNSRLWGGYASVGVPRYAYFKSISYTPLGTK